MRTVTVPVIESDADLGEALKRLNRIFMAELGTPEADERKALALVIENYERTNHAIQPPRPVDAILFAMSQRGYSSAEVAEALEGPSRMSEVLNGKRNLSLRQIRRLNADLKIPLESLI